MSKFFIQKKKKNLLSVIGCIVFFKVNITWLFRFSVLTFETSKLCFVKRSNQIFFFFFPSWAHSFQRLETVNCCLNFIKRAHTLTGSAVVSVLVENNSGEKWAKCQRMWGVVVVVVVGSSERVPGPAKDAGVHGELVNESSGKGIHTGCLGVLDTGPSSWGHEECSIYHYVPICPPVPPCPLSLVCVHALCHLWTKSKSSKSQHIIYMLMLWI